MSEKETALLNLAETVGMNCERCPVEVQDALHAIPDILKTHPVHDRREPEDRFMDHAGYDAGAAEWVRCGDRLPPELTVERYLVTLANGSVFEAQYRANGTWWLSASQSKTYPSNPVIAWHEPIPPFMEAVEPSTTASTMTETP